jgi:hypothetical protein
MVTLSATLSTYRATSPKCQTIHPVAAGSRSPPIHCNGPLSAFSESEDSTPIAIIAAATINAISA